MQDVYQNVRQLTQWNYYSKGVQIKVYDQKTKLWSTRKPNSNDKLFWSIEVFFTHKVNVLYVKQSKLAWLNDKKSPAKFLTLSSKHITLTYIVKFHWDMSKFSHEPNL